MSKKNPRNPRLVVVCFPQPDPKARWDDKTRRNPHPEVLARGHYQSAEELVRKCWSEMSKLKPSQRFCAKFAIGFESEPDIAQRKKEVAVSWSETRWGNGTFEAFKQFIMDLLHKYFPAPVVQAT